MREYMMRLSHDGQVDYLAVVTPSAGEARRGALAVARVFGWRVVSCGWVSVREV